jgi:hypothetical protein
VAAEKATTVATESQSSGSAHDDIFCPDDDEVPSMMQLLDDIITGGHRLRRTIVHPLSEPSSWNTEGSKTGSRFRK